MTREIVLASASPRRRELLGLLGIRFRAVAADIDEKNRHGLLPAELARALSQEKAFAIAKEAHDGLIIASDTIVALDGEVLGKPADEEEARAMLRRLRGRPHQVISAVTVLDASGGCLLTDHACTMVHMRRYSDEEIDLYIRSGDPMDKAGAYAIQNPEFRPAASFEGCYANVMGLPLCYLYRLLRRLEVDGLRRPALACMRFTGQPCEVYPSILGEETAGDPRA